MTDRHPMGTTPHVDSNQPDDHRVIRLPHLIALTGLSRSSIYERMCAHGKYHDPSFPRKVPLHCGSRGAVGWFLSDVNAWLLARHSSSTANQI